MTQRTNQEMFDTVYRHFVHKGEPRSENAASGVCYYRHDNGAKCAAGLFIKDEDYHPQMEGKDIRTVMSVDSINVPPMLPRGYFGNDAAIEFLHALQRCHDGATDAPNHMQSSLNDLASRYELTVPIA